MSNLLITRNRKTIIVAFIALIILVTAGSFFYSRAVSNLTTTHSEAVAKGLGYLKSNPDKVSGLQWFVLDYLQRKFDLDPWFSAKNRDIKPPPDEPNATDFELHKRIAYPDSKVDSLPYAEALPVRQMMMASTHCDYIPLPPDFEQLIEDNIERGGYSLTHIAYSLERMKENGCQFDAAVDQQLRDKSAASMVKLVEDSTTSPDMRYESIAFLMHMGRRDLVREEWIKKIVSEQQRDGGWMERQKDKTSNDHATVLAVWALLEYSHPNAPPEPVLRRPTRI